MPCLLTAGSGAGTLGPPFRTDCSPRPLPLSSSRLLAKPGLSQEGVGGVPCSTERGLGSSGATSSLVAPTSGRAKDASAASLSFRGASWEEHSGLILMSTGP